MWRNDRMLKRWRREPEPVPEWKQRLDRARRVIEQNQDHSAPLVWIDRIEETIRQAQDQDERLRTALAQLDLDHVERELKAALRDKHDHTAEDSALILTLRRRRETIHSLIDQREAIDDQIATTLADLDTLAARTAAGPGFGGDTDEPFREDLQRLEDDINALAAAQREIADL